MKIHDRAWAGFRIAVIGGQPLVAMKIEQAFAAAAPATEVQLSSFETYDEAYEYCKKNRNIGFFLITERCQELSFQQVFRELAAQYQAQNIPPFAAILHEGTRNSFCEGVIAKSSNFLSYISADEFLSADKTATIVSQLWTTFTEAFEQSVLPEGLQRTLRSLAEAVSTPEEILFTDRVTTNLCSDLNLSWYEYVALKWAVVLKKVNSASPAALKPHDNLIQFLSTCMPASSDAHSSVEALLLSNAPLPKKVFRLVEHLETHRQADTLKSEIDRLAAYGKPGAAKLFRHLAKNGNRLASFAGVAGEHGMSNIA